MVEGTAMGSEAEIAARLERATRSGLASSCLDSFSYSQGSSTKDRPPTLADLLPHLGTPGAPRCPACRAPPPFGPHSRICLACMAPLIQSSPPSFTSTLAFRRFSESLHINGLETDSGEVDEELGSDLEVDAANKSFSSLSLPLEVSGQKILSHEKTPSDLGKSKVEPETMRSTVQSPLSMSAGSVTPATPMGLTNVDGGKHASILDYSAKLEGISLEDFFSNQVKSQAPDLATNSDMLLDTFSASMDTSCMNVGKDSLVWDPSSESIIPDGFDLMASTSEANTTKVVVVNNGTGVEEDDDPFSSWEGDFQSAAPAMTDVSAAPSDTRGSQGSAYPITSRNIEDLFSDISNMSVGESIRIRTNNNLVNDGDPFGLDADTKDTFKTDTQRTGDVDDFFGSGWQHTFSHSAVPIISETQSLDGLIKQSALLDSRTEEGLPGICSCKQMEGPFINNSSDSVGESTSTEDFLMERTSLASESVQKKNKIVGSLLAQLHDLSFLLADKLVTKTEGKSTKLSSFS